MFLFCSFQARKLLHLKYFELGKEDDKMLRIQPNLFAKKTSEFACAFEFKIYIVARLQHNPIGQNYFVKNDPMRCSASSCTF